MFSYNFVFIQLIYLKFDYYFVGALIKCSFNRVKDCKIMFTINIKSIIYVALPLVVVINILYLYKLDHDV